MLTQRVFCSVWRNHNCPYAVGLEAPTTHHTHTYTQVVLSGFDLHLVFNPEITHHLRHLAHRTPDVPLLVLIKLLTLLL